MPCNCHKNRRLDGNFPCIDCKSRGDIAIKESKYIISFKEMPTFEPLPEKSPQEITKEWKEYINDSIAKVIGVPKHILSPRI